MTKETHNVKDPVCGMDVKPKNVGARSEFQGKEYYFCSTACKEKFDQNPNQYTKQVA